LNLNPLILTSKAFGNAALQEPLKRACAAFDPTEDGDVCGFVSRFSVSLLGRQRESTIQEFLQCYTDKTGKTSWETIPAVNLSGNPDFNPDTAFDLFRIYYYTNNYLRNDITKAANELFSVDEGLDYHDLDYIVLPGAGIIYNAKAVSAASEDASPQGRITELTDVLRIVVPEPVSAHETLEYHTRAKQLLPLAEYLSRDNIVDIDALEIPDD
jgi:hypothetical protein